VKGRKPAPAAAASNVVAGPGADRGVELPEPDWMMAWPGEEWATRSAELASEFWEKVRFHMERAGTLGPENASALEILAINYARWRLAEAHVLAHGPVVAAPRTGVPMQNPYLSIANAAAEKVMKLEAELGLPPSMRARVSKAQGQKRAARASDAFLKQKGG
jgi:P27 family predicted phage terminase small subunit